MFDNQGYWKVGRFSLRIIFHSIQWLIIQFQFNTSITKPTFSRYSQLSCNSNLDNSKFSISRLNKIPHQITITFDVKIILSIPKINKTIFRYLEFSHQNLVLKICSLSPRLFFAYDLIYMYTIIENKDVILRNFNEKSITHKKNETRRMLLYKIM